MGPIGFPETSVRNYHSTLREIPKELRSHLYRGGSLKSHTQNYLFGVGFILLLVHNYTETDPRVVLLFVRETRDLSLSGKCRDSSVN